MVRFCIVGTNFISDNFADAIASVKDAEIVGIYSRKFDTGADFAKKHGIKKVFTDYRDVLESNEVDAVYVASPTFLHCEHTVLALNAGKHVLCEKSIATDYSEFLTMKAAAEKSGTVFLEAMRTAFDPAIRIISDNLCKLGMIRRISLEFCKYSSRYDKFKMGVVENAFNPDIKNSALSDLGVYPLWLLVALFGKPQSVLSDSVGLSNGFEGAGAVILGYGDKIATVTYSKITEGVLPSVIEGELGSLIIDKISEPKKITMKLRGCGEEIINYTPVSNNMVYEIEAFCDMVNAKKSSKPYLDISEAVIQLITNIQS